MLYLDFLAVLNSQIYLSIRVVNFSRKCHFDALKLIMSNQPTRDCDSLFQSVLKNVDFLSLATDIASTRTLTCCIPLCASLPPLSPCGFFFVDFRITSAQRDFLPREIHDNFLIRSYDLRFLNSEAGHVVQRVFHNGVCLCCVKTMLPSQKWFAQSSQPSDRHQKARIKFKKKKKKA